ncbi:MAG: SpoIIE family protein phosphatase, partial [Armatimonadota bacterium]
IMVKHWDGSLFVSRHAGEPSRYRNEKALTDACDLRTVTTMESLEAQVIRDVRKHAGCIYSELASSDSESCSVLSIPLVQEKKTIGLLNIFAKDDREFTTGENRLFGSLSSLAAAAISRAQVFERERRIAETFQRSFLPDISDQYGEYEIARQYAAALEEARIGGDFYDVFHVGEDKLALVIGDVSGKGLDAAVHTATAKYLIRAFAFEEHDPGHILSRANDALCFYVPESMFVTLFLAVLDTKTGFVYYANAGHELPLVWSRKAARFRSLACTGRALGFMANCQYLTEQVVLEQGDVLLMYTDGITEARKDGKFFDTRGVRDAAEPIIHASAAQVAESIESEVRKYTGGKLRDDIALLVVKRQG